MNVDENLSIFRALAEKNRLVYKKHNRVYSRVTL